MSGAEAIPFPQQYPQRMILGKGLAEAIAVWWFSLSVDLRKNVVMGTGTFICLLIACNAITLQ